MQPITIPTLTTTNHNVTAWIHGYGETEIVWNPFIAMFPNQQHWCIPLHQWMDCCAESSFYAMAQLFWKEADKKGLDKLNIVANSMGGYLALEILRAKPERIINSHFISSHPFTDSPQKTKKRNRELQFILQGRQKLIGLQWAKSNPQNMHTTILSLWNVWTKKGLMNAIEALIQRRDHSQWLEENPVIIHWITGGLDSSTEMQKFTQWVKDRPSIPMNCIPNAHHLMVLAIQAELIQILSNK